MPEKKRPAFSDRPLPSEVVWMKASSTETVLSAVERRCWRRRAARVDAGGEAELGFGQAEAARAGADLGVGRQREAGDAGLRGILRGVRVEAREDQRHRRVEGVGAAGGGSRSGRRRWCRPRRDRRAARRCTSATVAARRRAATRRRGARRVRRRRVRLGELRLRVVQLGLERADALVVVGLHRRERLLQVGDVAGRRGQRGALQADGQRERGDEAQRRWKARARAGRGGGGLLEHETVSRLAARAARQARAGTGVVGRGAAAGWMRAHAGASGKCEPGAVRCDRRARGAARRDARRQAVRTGCAGGARDA